MKYKFLEEQFTYDGSQLRSLFGYLDHKVLGDSMMAWVGPCQIPTDKIVDGEDLLAGEKIEGSKMLHFVLEVFPSNLALGVSLQRLLASTIQEEIFHQCEIGSRQLVRRGDDLFFDERKLSISIATNSPSSTLVHFAMNVSNEGTPVPTASLEDLSLDPKSFSEKVGQRFCLEYHDIQTATKKVKWVR